MNLRGSRHDQVAKHGSERQAGAWKHGISSTVHGCKAALRALQGSTVHGCNAASCAAVLLLGATRRFGSLFSYTEERPRDAHRASLGHPVSFGSDTGFRFRAPCVA
eukprot:1136942-Pelagomonas_calceolata.AAC.3